MIQISQYFSSQYIEIYLLLFVLISMIIFFSLIIKSFKEKPLKENEENNEPKKHKFLLGQSIKNITVGKIISISIYRIIPILYIIFLFFWSLMSFIPITISHFLPADSKQIFTLTNNTKKNTDFALVGRLSYSNVWKPIIPYSPLFQGCAVKTLKKGESMKMELRTGVKDIDYLMIVNFSKDERAKGAILSLPRNEFALFIGQLRELPTKPSIFLLTIILNIVLYFSALIGCMCIFCILYNSISFNLVKLIIYGVICLIPSIFFGFVFWWNLDALRYFLFL